MDNNVPRPQAADSAAFRPTRTPGGGVTGTRTGEPVLGITGIAALLFAVAFGLSCGDPCDSCPSGPEPPAIDVTGVWTGSARAFVDRPDTVSLELMLVQIDTLVVGRLDGLIFTHREITRSCWQGDTLGLIVLTETGREVAFQARVVGETLTGWWWYMHGADHPGQRWWRVVRSGGASSIPAGG